MSPHGEAKEIQNRKRQRKQIVNRISIRISS